MLGVEAPVRVGDAVLPSLTVAGIRSTDIGATIFSLFPSLTDRSPVILAFAVDKRPRLTAIGLGVALALILSVVCGLAVTESSKTDFSGSSRVTRGLTVVFGDFTDLLSSGGEVADRRLVKLVMLEYAPEWTRGLAGRSRVDIECALARLVNIPLFCREWAGLEALEPLFSTFLLRVRVSTSFEEK